MSVTYNKKQVEDIAEIIKQYDGSLITSKQIHELMDDPVSLTGVKYILHEYVLRDYPDIISVPRRGYRYAAKPERETKVFKNEEGYPDPTAGKALANVMMTPKEQETNYFPGEVWTRATSPYLGPKKKELALVIAASKGVVNYIPVRDYVEEGTYYFSGYCTEFESPSGKKYFVDWRQIRTSGCNPFKDGSYEFALDDDIFSKIMSQIGKRFGIGEVIVKEVPSPPKVVYETKEVPATITEEDAIKFLTDNGWLTEHDNGVRSNAMEEFGTLFSRSADIWEARYKTLLLAVKLMCGKE